ncbi:hypothetical protein [Streptomyces sp. NPDC053431]|uniref:hypothetical protein n=1 Tax=Streptomyces sp. NPDC053431 TaxID=3365703 RepID=UPI0037CE7E3A
MPGTEATPSAGIETWAHVHRDLGRVDLAHDHARQALDLYTALAVPEADEMRVSLAGLPPTAPGSTAHQSATDVSVAHDSVAPEATAHESTAPGSIAYEPSRA